MKTIGIIGGMGPMATVDLFGKIVAATAAEKDQEHIHILVDNNTDIPDRSAAICGTGPSPVPQMLASVQRLTREGADVLVMGCNTAHYFLPELRPQLQVPFIDMIEETARYCRKKQIGCAGLLASAGTYASGIYRKMFLRFGLELIEPDADGQNLCQDIIFNGVKAGCTSYPVEPFVQMLRHMEARGVESFVLGCTEMPLAVRTYHLDGDFIDATQVLAEAAVRFAGARCQAESVHIAGRRAG
jgi:aspartate racemase